MIIMMRMMNNTNEMNSGARLRLSRSHGVTLGQELVTHGGQVSILTRLDSGYHVSYECQFVLIQFLISSFTNMKK